MAKKDYDKTLTRLMGILSMLSLNREPDTRSLAEEFNVSVRTIQKDIYRRLQSFPIVKNERGKFVFAEGFSLDRSLLDPEEMILLSLALSPFHHIEDFNRKSRAIVRKLLYPKIVSPYYIKHAELEPLETASEPIRLLKEAIAQRRLALLRMSGGEETKVEPYKIVNFDGFWYLFAQSLSENRVKMFTVNRIESVKTLDMRYERTTRQIDEMLEHAHSAWFEEGKCFEVRVRVEASIAHFFKRRSFLRSQRILEEERDGALVVAFEVTHDEDVDNLIKAWLPHLEVLSPERFRSRLIAELETYLQRVRSEPRSSQS